MSRTRSTRLKSIRGFLAVLDREPGLEPNLRRACDYVTAQIGADGKVNSPSLDMWKLADGSVLTDYCNLYVLPPLIDAGHRLGEAKYVEAAQRGLNYFRQQPDLVDFKSESGTFSHMFGYMMEALVDLGELELAKKGLEQAEAHPASRWQHPRVSRGDLDLLDGDGAAGDRLAQDRRSGAGAQDHQLPRAPSACERRLFRQLRKRRHLLHCTRKSAGA